MFNKYSFIIITVLITASCIAHKGNYKEEPIQRKTSIKLECLNRDSYVISIKNISSDTLEISDNRDRTRFQPIILDTLNRKIKVVFIRGNETIYNHHHRISPNSTLAIPHNTLYERQFFKPDANGHKIYFAVEINHNFFERSNTINFRN